MINTRRKKSIRAAAALGLIVGLTGFANVPVPVQAVSAATSSDYELVDGETGANEAAAGDESVSLAEPQSDELPSDELPDNDGDMLVEPGEEAAEGEPSVVDPSSDDQSNDGVLPGEDSSRSDSEARVKPTLVEFAGLPNKQMIVPFASGSDDYLVGASYGRPIFEYWGDTWVSPYAESIAWLDMSGFDEQVAGSPSGQNMSVQISDRYTMTFNVLFEDAGVWPRQGLKAVNTTGYQFNLVYYPGIDHRPVLYQKERQGNQSGSKVTLRNIQILNSQGQPVSYAMMMADAELTSEGEFVRIDTDVPLNYLELLDGQRFHPQTGELLSRLDACHQGIYGGVGRTYFECKPVHHAGFNYYDDYGGAFIAGADNPSYISGTFGNSSGATSRQAIAFGVMFSGARANDRISEFAKPGDSFTVHMETADEEFVHSTDGASSVTTGKKILLGETSGNPIKFYQEADPGTNGHNYVSDWTCSRNGVVDNQLSVKNVPYNHVVETTYGLGDFVECTVENRPVDLDVSKSVAGTTGTPAGTANPGDELTYTITFENDEPVASAVLSHMDNLADVLQHAELVPGSITVNPDNGGVVAELVADGQALMITGNVPPQSTVTVSYRVIVDERVPENQELINVVTPVPGTPTDPPTPPSKCDPEVEVCTFTPITPPGPHTVTVIKDLPGGRADSADQFTITLADTETETELTSATTFGDEAGLQEETTPEDEFINAFEVAPGMNYTIAEMAASDTHSGMENYETTWECRDEADVVLAEGEGVEGSFHMPDRGHLGADVVCIITNDVIEEVVVFVEKFGKSVADTYEPLAGSSWDVLPAEDATEPVEGVSVELIENEVARFVITGLKPGTYWLAETQAPEGFSLLAQPIEFTVAKDGTVTLGANAPSGIVEVVQNQDQEYSIHVFDVPQFDLPETGGTGIQHYYWVGLILLAGAAGLTALRIGKEKSAEIL